MVRNDVRRLIAALTLAALGGCGGGGGGGGGGDGEPAALTVTATTPADAAAGVDPASALAVDFSAVLDPASVGSNLTLQTATVPCREPSPRRARRRRSRRAVRSRCSPPTP